MAQTDFTADKLNKEQQQAFDLVANTNVSLFEGDWQELLGAGTNGYCSHQCGGTNDTLVLWLPSVSDWATYCNEIFGREARLGEDDRHNYCG